MKGVMPAPRLTEGIRQQQPEAGAGASKQKDTECRRASALFLEDFHQGRIEDQGLSGKRVVAVHCK